ncbi:hypothetical protein M231_05896 [Tremella mesenterica]|uniref:NAD-dependent epimerase/dehydratase domain-containing protein n=1 Tax=Tremella mesenterica TaxID=5217 RepID=A0A4Q1BGW5_TREME|nr:uncharacterized protein TREMEDRAFT_61410 [Tremella mesenterica DSM 1558]EIW70897.1 hypothetical protein TREMEDRAFT_61410 [Tremella mesenterica DSM 1558]RXK36812.1 hypothetical protein M231_05896 [Tremella mesenterica]
MTNKIAAITGQNGFIALHTALWFLEHGWDVRGSVRSESKAQLVRENPTFVKYAQEGRLELIVVPSLSGDVTKLLEGVAAVVHIATPMDMEGKGWESYVGDAKADVTNLLTAASKVPTIEAFSVMSSCALHLDPFNGFQGEPGKTYSEEDVSPVTEEQAANATLDSMIGWVTRYGKMKELTEQEAIKVHAALGAKFTLTLIRPTMVSGPSLDVTSPEGVPTASVSSRNMLALISGKDSPVQPDLGFLSVDARDVAKAFYEVVVRKTSGAYILNGPTYDNQLLVNVARSVRPDLDKYIPLGNPEKLPSKDVSYIFPGAKATKELGVEYHTLEESIRDTLAYFEQIGLFKA